jgi:hypothetical protein
MAAIAPHGAATRKTPKPVDTPLPPRKRSQMGNMFPRTAKRAARASKLRIGAVGTIWATNTKPPEAVPTTRRCSL